MKLKAWLAPFAVLGLTMVAAPAVWKSLRAETDLAARVAAIQAPAAVPVVPCWREGDQAPLVLLVLGQSNAGNHGAVPTGSGQLAQVFVGSGCQMIGAPLPGGTGRRGSIWSGLPAQLRRLGLERPVVIALLAVDATSMEEWAAGSGPLAARLDQTVKRLHAARLRPDWVLWQQGEADARAGTTDVAYAKGLRQLRSRLRAAGVTAPLLAARSTHCRGADGTGVRAAIGHVAAADGDVLLGPDTDSLTGPYRHGDCHFSQLGLEAAAAMWAQAIARLPH